jgi:DNA-binding MarR family transcriptional regulator
VLSPINSGILRHVKLRSGSGSLFGTETRTGILLLLSLMGESHAAELSRILEVRPYTVQRALDGLEQAGIVSGALVGRERRVRLDPRYFARDELRALLDKLALHKTDLQARVAEIRRRPRRSGKTL